MPLLSTSLALRFISSLDKHVADKEVVKEIHQQVNTYMDQKKNSGMPVTPSSLLKNFVIILKPFLRSDRVKKDETRIIVAKLKCFNEVLIKYGQGRFFAVPNRPNNIGQSSINLFSTPTPSRRRPVNIPQNLPRMSQNMRRMDRNKLNMMPVPFMVNGQRPRLNAANNQLPSVNVTNNQPQVQNMFSYPIGKLQKSFMKPKLGDDTIKRLIARSLMEAWNISPRQNIQVPVTYSVLMLPCNGTVTDQVAMVTIWAKSLIINIMESTYFHSIKIQKIKTGMLRNEHGEHEVLFSVQPKFGFTADQAAETFITFLKKTKRERSTFNCCCMKMLPI